MDRQTDTRTPRASEQSSGQGQGLGKASPEPRFGAGVGVIADSDEPQDAGELFLHCLVLDGDQSLLMGTWREAECKFGLEVTFLALQVIIRDNHHHPAAPLFDEFTSNGPDTGARQDITVRHTQLQSIVCLFQLPDHLLHKLDVAGAIADEGIETLRHMPWVHSTRVVVRAPWEVLGGVQPRVPCLGNPGPCTLPKMILLRESALPGRGKMNTSGAKLWINHEIDIVS